MFQPLNLPVVGIASFCKFAVHTDVASLAADVAVLGVPWDGGVGFRPGARFGPRAIREFSTRYSFHERGEPMPGYFDMGRRRRVLGHVKIVDCGDVDVVYTQVEETFRRITWTVEQVLQRGAFPVVLGGDHSISFPAVRAFAEGGPLGVLHIDAHLDYNDEVAGVRFANGNPIKRISELSFVGPIVQVGLRGFRGREAPYFDSLARGNLIVTAHEVRACGTDWVLDRIPQAPRWYITTDIDSLDPSCAPGTGSPEPEGLSYGEVKQLLAGIASRHHVVGFDLVEVNPLVDPTGLTASVATTLVLELLAARFG
jgi:agmatinase